ncbi:MAG TPA: endonuclease/exonuclease/phosphatase family protein [Caulifigura sp.]|nr:endonuclease/exonuclease/phosphatase family protein [Caulifigura sp.]
MIHVNRRQATKTLAGLGIAALAPSTSIAFQGRDESKKQAVVRVLSYNIWVGGERGGVEQTAEVIKASRADLVGIQEAKTSGFRLAELTGLTLFDQGDRVVLSRFPVLAQSPRKYGVRVEIPGGGPVWMFNAHLPASPYQPYQLNGIPYGKENPMIETAAEAIGEALRARGSRSAELLSDLGHAFRTGEPILLTGDFNEPSHLDWTARAAAAGRCKLPVAWPTSRAMCDAGLTDVFRTLHPDEVTRPGATWTPVPGAREVHDRIDFIYSSGLTPQAVQIIGEAGGPVDLSVKPYPSDHRAVVATLSFR